MKRKIFIGIGVVIMVLGAAFMYLNNRNRTLSPPGSAELTNGKLAIQITYSRPSVRGRLIFGSEEEGALQPWGVYWRLGANEATEVTFGSDVLFNGMGLSKGTYKMYALPGKETFSIVLNSELGNWGAFEPNYDLDVLTTNVPVEQIANVEQHTISLLELGQDTTEIRVEFADVRLRIPVIAQ